jgi:hypothetical protein
VEHDRCSKGALYSFTSSYVDNLAFKPLKKVSYTHRDATDILHPRDQASVQAHSTKTVNFFPKSPFSYVLENTGTAFKIPGAMKCYNHT